LDVKVIRLFVIKIAFAIQTAFWNFLFNFEC
jgi:hypothetical protein